MPTECVNWDCRARVRRRTLTGDESDAAGVGLRDLDVGDEIRRNNDLPTPLVGQAERAVDALERCRHRRFDLFWGQRGLQHDLARRVQHADLDLHPTTSSWALDGNIFHASRGHAPIWRPVAAP